jgi:Transposase IS66 family
MFCRGYGNIGSVPWVTRSASQSVYKWMEALRRISELYAIEERVRGQPPAIRLVERRTLSKPLVEKLKVWLEQ